MIFFEQIKQYINAIIGIATIVAIVACLVFTYNKGQLSGISKEQVKTEAIQKEFIEYKTSMEAQVAQIKAENEKIKIEQDKKYAKAKADYYRDTTLLAERLRDLPPMLCGEEQLAMRVAETSGSTMSTEADSSTGVTKAIASATGTRPTFKYNDALEDTLQCSNLIDFVKKNY